jgi:hypothetical protein
METIRTFMESIRAFMEYDSIDVHKCAKFIGLIAQKVLKNYMRIISIKGIMVMNN